MAAPKFDKATADKIRAEAKHWPEKGRVRMFALRYGVRPEAISAILNDRTYAEA